MMECKLNNVGKQGPRFEYRYPNCYKNVYLGVDAYRPTALGSNNTSVCSLWINTFQK